MEDYRPNSHRSKKEGQEPTKDKKVKKVVTGKVKQKKNSVRKWTSLFLPEDVGSVKDYILIDVVIPLVRRAISDTVEGLLYPGESRSRDRRSTPLSRVSYSSYWDGDDRRRNDHSSPSKRARVGYNFSDIVLEHRRDAEEVLLEMDRLIDLYEVVTVADLYDLVDVTGNYTDNKYGWTDLLGAEPVRVRDGYMLKLPRALPLN